MNHSYCFYEKNQLIFGKTQRQIDKKLLMTVNRKVTLGKNILKIKILHLSASQIFSCSFYLKEMYQENIKNELGVQFMQNKQKLMLSRTSEKTT